MPGRADATAGAPMTIATTRKTVMVRDMDADLWDRVRERAKAEGVYMRAWIERALERELVRAAAKKVK